MGSFDSHRLHLGISPAVAHTWYHSYATARGCVQTVNVCEEKLRLLLCFGTVELGAEEQDTRRLLPELCVHGNTSCARTRYWFRKSLTQILTTMITGLELDWTQRNANLTHDAVLQDERFYSSRALIQFIGEIKMGWWIMTSQTSMQNHHSILHTYLILIKIVLIRILKHKCKAIYFRLI